jgi:hypothetical protein
MGISHEQTLGAVTGATLLALVGVANGGERAKTSTDAQLDTVVAA